MRKYYASLIKSEGEETGLRLLPLTAAPYTRTQTQTVTHIADKICKAGAEHVDFTLPKILSIFIQGERTKGIESVIPSSQKFLTQEFPFCRPNSHVYTYVR